MNVKIITILIVGVVFTVGLAVSFGIPAFAGDPVPGLDITIEQIPGGEVSGKIYDSALSTKSVGLVRTKIGDALLRYGIGGEDINKVTDALEGSGVYEAELKSFLINIGIDKNGVIEVFATLDELGVGFIKLDDEEKAISAPDAEVTTQAVEKIELAVEQVKRGEAPASGTGDVSTSVVDSFFDVYTELGIFIEVIAEDANITKTDARKVVDALMKVSPTFTIDENGLQDDEEARLIAVVIIGALKSELTAKRALDSFVGATTKSLRGSDRVALVGFGSFSISKREARTIGAGQVTEIIKGVTEIKDSADLAKTVARVKYSNITLERGYLAFNEASEDIIQNIKFASPEERKNLIEELKVNRKTLRTEILSMSLSTRENAKALRENFRENMRATIGHVDHGKTAKIIIAHGKGVRMLNRYNSAIARFDHILGKIESRSEKNAQLYTKSTLHQREGGSADDLGDAIDMSVVTLLIEEAKNMSVANKVELEQLKAKYEELLLGENSQGIAKEARVIATELKTKIQTLHDKLREIVGEIRKNNIDRRDLTLD